MRILITLLMSISLSFAFGLDWAHSYKQVMAQAKKENKPVLIFMSQPGCGSCAYMKENVFLDGDVMKYMKEHFVFAELNIYENDAPDELKVKATPVFYFLDSEGNHLRKKAEIKLNDQLLFLEALMDAIPNPIYYKDKEHRYIGCNTAFLTFTGLEKEQIIGQTAHDLFPKYAEEMKDVDCAVLKEQGVVTKEVVLEDAKGEERDIVLYKSSYFNTTKDVCGVVGMMADITDLKKIMDKQKEQEQILIHQSRMAAMGEMIGNIAHQWRQPISTISLLIQDINDAYEYGELTKEYLEDFSTKTLKQVKFMSETIDDFRDYLRPNKITEPFSLVESVKNSIRIMDATFRNNNVKVDFKYDNDIEVMGYKNEFSQVLLNIFKNAKDEFELRDIKEGLLQIKLEEMGEKAVLTITDNAGGIPEGVVDKVFEPYFSTKEDVGGTGIGLHMSKNIIETNMDGTIDVQNVKNGAEFTIRLKKSN